MLSPRNPIEIWPGGKETKDTKGGPTAAQGKGKANGQAKLPASYAKKFNGDFGDSTPIRAKADHAKILSFKTYGRLKDFLVKSFAEGKTKTEIAEGLGVTGAKVNELAICLRINQPKGKPDICVDRPTIGPDGEFRMEAPRESKAKKA